MNYDPNRIHHNTYAEIAMMVKALQEDVQNLCDQLNKTAAMLDEALDERDEWKAKYEELRDERRDI